MQQLGEKSPKPALLTDFHTRTPDSMDLRQAGAGAASLADSRVPAARQIPEKDRLGPGATTSLQLPGNRNPRARRPSAPATILIATLRDRSIPVDESGKP